MKSCPNCGSENGFVVHGTAAGKVAGYYDGEGFSQEVDTDSMYFRMSNTVRCQDCLKIRRDVQRVGVRIVSGDR